MAARQSLTDDEILRRIPTARSREEADHEAGLRATKAFYDPINDLVMIETTRGFRWGIPRRGIPALSDASSEDLARLLLSPSGDGLHWEVLDVQLSVPGLLVDALGAGTLARELARRGGQSTSGAKVEAARRNGAKGGRPVSKASLSHTARVATVSRKGSSGYAVPSPARSRAFVVKEVGKSQSIARPTKRVKSLAKGVSTVRQHKPSK